MAENFTDLMKKKISVDIKQRNQLQVEKYKKSHRETHHN